MKNLYQEIWKDQEIIWDNCTFGKRESSERELEENDKKSFYHSIPFCNGFNFFKIKIFY